ncbi:MAG: hypothetical protein CBE02_03005 [Gammaproteobacteria bacterium TMED242]|nr:MAG: hypothetical protein CBE02_03005 [Gammaproteobacteria bacterium TMED242]
MKVLAIQSSGDQTSICLIHNDDVLTFSQKHQRKKRPDWNNMLINLGLNKLFNIDEICLFAFANSSRSYTATRSIATYMKGLAVALKKPLIAVSSDDIDELYADSIAKLALLEYENSGLNSEMFNPKNANPIYSQDLQYKKVNE